MGVDFVRVDLMHGPNSSFIIISFINVTKIAQSLTRPLSSSLFSGFRAKSTMYGALANGCAEVT